ncbi:MAG: NAD(P)H-binding protein [Gammaproteobacteria bacterium]
MKGRIFVAGATGAVGKPLCQLLVADGWRVTGSTRKPGRGNELRALGVEPVIVDVFDAESLRAAVNAAWPDVVIHQLTDLPPALDPTQMEAGRARNARIREEGTRNLVAAAVGAGAKRMIAQSIAFAYAAAGTPPYREDAPLDPAARAVASLEQQVLAAPLVGIVLRYGRFYGPGTGFDKPAAGGAVHVEAAADAARRAVTRGAQGVYNVAEPGEALSSAKANADLAWTSDFRIAH